MDGQITTLSRYFDVEKHSKIRDRGLTREADEVFHPEDYQPVQPSGIRLILTAAPTFWVGAAYFRWRIRQKNL